MASASLAEVRAYLGIDGDDHDTLLNLFLARAESYVRRLATIGDEVETDGTYKVGFPDDLKLAQLLVCKFYWDRREAPADAKSPPPLYGYLGPYERIGTETDPNRVISRGPAGRAPTEAEIAVAVNAYLADNPVDPMGVVTQQQILNLTNADIKRLNTDLIELVPAPGPLRYIEIKQVWLEKSGVDQPPTHTEFYRIAISPNAVLTEAEALQIDGRPNTFSNMPVPDWDTPHYFYAGTSATNQDVNRVDGLSNFDATFQRVPGTIDVDGLAIKWWRTNDTYPTRTALFRGLTGTRVRRDFNAPIPSRIGAQNYLSFLYASNPAADRPYGPDEYTSDVFWTWDELLALEHSGLSAHVVGGQTLLENEALSIGSIVGADKALYYSESVWNQYFDPVDDVRFLLLVRYQVHSTLIQQ